jgi:hypothetical protein
MEKDKEHELRVSLAIIKVLHKTLSKNEKRAHACSFIIFITFLSRKTQISPIKGSNIASMHPYHHHQPPIPSTLYRESNQA